MTVDAYRSLITYLWTRLTTDSALQTIMGGTILCYEKEVDATFPYLVHRLNLRNEPGAYPVQRATYFLDIWSDSPNMGELTDIRERIVQLLDELVFSTDDVTQVHIEMMTSGNIPESEQNIWHHAFLWELIYVRKSEAASIESR